MLLLTAELAWKIDNALCFEKAMPDIFGSNLSKDCEIIFGGNAASSVILDFRTSPGVRIAAAVPGQCDKHQIVSFH